MLILFFSALLISAALMLAVVSDIEYVSRNNPARLGLLLPTYGQPTGKVAHPWSSGIVGRAVLRLRGDLEIIFREVLCFSADLILTF